jgi:hypothetical protein
MTCDLEWSLGVIWRSRMWKSPIGLSSCRWDWHVVTNTMKYYLEVDIGLSEFANKFDLGLHWRVISRSWKWKLHVATHRWEMDHACHWTRNLIQWFDSKKIDLAPWVGHPSNSWASCVCLSCWVGAFLFEWHNSSFHVRGYDCNDVNVLDTTVWCELMTMNNCVYRTKYAQCCARQTFKICPALILKRHLSWFLWNTTLTKNLPMIVLWLGLRGRRYCVYKAVTANDETTILATGDRKQ